jgi:hypothetical protein
MTEPRKFQDLYVTAWLAKLEQRVWPDDQPRWFGDGVTEADISHGCLADVHHKCLVLAPALCKCICHGRGYE